MAGLETQLKELNNMELEQMKELSNYMKSYEDLINKAKAQGFFVKDDE